jgi:hypothetical protein
MTTEPEVMCCVRPGQIWADADPRAASRHRTLRVEFVDSRYAYCITVDPGTHRRWGVSRKTRIAIDRMRPTSTGYRLVTDVPA